MPNSALFDAKEAGSISEIRKSILRVKGLPSCAFGQPLTLKGDLKAMVIGFDKDYAEVLPFGDISNLKSGDAVYAQSEKLVVPVGEAFIGRVVDGLAEPCDGREAIRPSALASVFAEVPAITERSALSRQLYMGTLIVDATIPIAKGQRELIIGDRMTGKTSIAIDAILNQKNKNVICIYCCIGKNHESLVKIVRLLEERKAMDYSIVVSGTADSSVGQQYLAPYTAATLGEYLMRKGMDVLVVLDDMTKHAWVYRQISLLMGRSPGREAYPGDVFYVHSQLVERAAQLSQKNGGGSMTFLPIVETQQGDLTGYISSNLISMTDGQIYLSTDLFKEGFKPALDVGLSVSRIGNKIQPAGLKALSATLRLEYVKAKELISLTKLRSNISKEAKVKLARGLAMQEALKQTKNEPMSLSQELLLLHALQAGLFDDNPPIVIQDFKETFWSFLSEKHEHLIDLLQSGEILSDEMRSDLERIARDYMQKKIK